jgi:phospholipid/cholesterol/gamma-HCH transport system ATP-binding protein
VKDQDTHIAVRDLTVSYGSYVIQRDLNFEITRGEIFVIMGGSGSGKSTLMKSLIGLNAPAAGSVEIDGVDLWRSGPDRRREIMLKGGVLFQGGALWSSMTLGENLALMLEQYTELGRSDIDDMVSFKLGLVGLAGFEDFYPSEISGGMRKRAGLARAMALDPSILFFDEPSSGLDPVSSRRLDELILELRSTQGTTVVIASHELASIFALADDSILLDTESKTMIARGNPNVLLKESNDTKVQAFLRRGEI